jgi:hypothetical protein
MEVSGQLHARPLYPQGKSPWYPLDRTRGGPQSHSGRGGEEKNSQPRRNSNPRTPTVQPVAQRYTYWAITALAGNKQFILKYHKKIGSAELLSFPKENSF